MNIRISSAQFFLSGRGDGTYVRSIAPDVAVATTIEDVLTSYDRQMEYVIDRVAANREP
ncbi:MAG: hypothetical protein GVY29_08910 [Spirochaetes bacterium]|nr:hypothetical protein [Spirochaetota bacterium]